MKTWMEINGVTPRELIMLKEKSTKEGVGIFTESQFNQRRCGRVKLTQLEVEYLSDLLERIRAFIIEK